MGENCRLCGFTQNEQARGFCFEIRLFHVSSDGTTSQSFRNFGLIRFSGRKAAMKKGFCIALGMVLVSGSVVFGQTSSTEKSTVASLGAPTTRDENSGLSADGSPP